MFGGFGPLLARELRLALRHGSDTVMVLGFFVIAVALFPFGVGPAPEILARIAVGILWVAALLAALLSLDRLYQQDYEDGSLDLLLLAPAPTELVVLAKGAAHWLTTGLPLVVLAPGLGVLMRLDPSAYLVMIATLALGTPALTLIGGVGAALTLGARRGGVLMSLLVLPLYIPILIFGVSAIDAVINDLPARPHLLLLGALCLGALAIAPFVTAAALRQAAE